MASYIINYAYTIGDHVWIIDGDNIIECAVKRIVLEIDPEQNGTNEEKRTYYIDPIYDNSCDMLEYSESNLFPSLESILDYRVTGIMPEPTRIYNQEYNYISGDTVWVIEKSKALESKVIQVTINLGQNIHQGPATDVWYHVLPLSTKYSVRVIKSVDIFDTKEDARDKIREDLESGLTPTPTVTPEVTPTITVTPTPTVTPVPTTTPSIIMPFILTEDGDYLSTEDSDPLLLE